MAKIMTPEFGPSDWYVEEKYGEFLAAPNGVEQTWRDYLTGNGHGGTVLSAYPQVTNIRWVQEEPANQGAWLFPGLELPDRIPRLGTITRISRRSVAAPSAGSARVHEVEQAAVIAVAFTR